MSIICHEFGKKTFESEKNLFEEDDAHYITLGNKGYAICWVHKAEIKTEPDQIFFRLFDSKGWPRSDEVLISYAMGENFIGNKQVFPVLNFPVMRIIENDTLIIAWAEDMDDIYIQMLDLKGNFIGDRMKSSAFHNLSYNREGIEIFLDLLFPMNKISN